MNNYEVSQPVRDSFYSAPEVPGVEWKCQCLNARIRYSIQNPDITKFQMDPLYHYAVITLLIYYLTR